MFRSPSPRLNRIPGANCLARSTEYAIRSPLSGGRIAVQEYGVSNPELLPGCGNAARKSPPCLCMNGILPEDTRTAAAAPSRKLRGNEIDVILFTTATQADHLLHIAQEMNERDAVLRAFSKMLVASIGPTTSERLREFGIEPDLEPEHPKMGYLVSEAAQRSGEILKQKRAAQGGILNFASDMPVPTARIAGTKEYGLHRAL